MPGLHIYNIILPKYFVKVKEKGSSLNFSALGGWDKEKNHKPAEKIAGDFQRAGKKKRGSGGNEFLPARSVWGGKRFRNSALAEYQNRKIFVSLIENNFGGARLKNVKKIFLFCSPSGERKRWAGQSAKSSGFCSKKVLTSSSRHHHIELAASLGASPLASAGSFASKSKGFLKSIESFCWLIWRFANLKSLPCFEKNRSRFLSFAVGGRQSEILLNCRCAFPFSITIKE